MNGTQSDLASLNDARSSFCKQVSEINIYADPPWSELGRYSATLRTSSKELERAGDAELAATAKSLADGMDAAQEITELVAYLHDGIPATTIDQLRRSIGRMPEVARLEVISKQEAFEEFKRLYEDDPHFLKQITKLGPDALPASLRVVVENPDDLANVRSQLESAREVEEVRTPSVFALTGFRLETLQGVDRACLLGESIEGSDGRTSPGSEVPIKTNAQIHYEVRLRDAGSVAVTIQFRLPSGELRSEQVQTPWKSAPMAFEEGAHMFIRAETQDAVKSPLLCVLASQEVEEGAYVLSSVDDPLSACRTEYELGQWPPDDDDPIGNLLIRVG